MPNHNDSLAESAFSKSLREKYTNLERPDPENLKQHLVQDFGSLDEVYRIAREIIKLIYHDLEEEIPSQTKSYLEYSILKMKIDRGSKLVRPIDRSLFVADLETFDGLYNKFCNLLMC